MTLTGALVLDLIDARRQALYDNGSQTEAEFELFASETEGAIFRIAAQVLGGTPARLRSLPRITRALWLSSRRRARTIAMP